MVFCHDCQIYVSKLSSHRRSNAHKSNSLLRSEYSNVQIIATAFRNRVISYKINPKATYLIPEQFLAETTSTIHNLINSLLKKHRSLKVNFELFITYKLPKNDTSSLKSFNTKYSMVFQSTNILQLYHEQSNILALKCVEFEHAESGWMVESISHLEMNVAKFNPLKAGSYLPLPVKIKNTKSCLNIRNNDEYCFLWSIIAQLYPSKSNPNRVSSYPHYLKLFNISDMSFPPNFADIKWFEKHNPSVSVNIYGLDKNNKVTGPLYKTQLRRFEHVNLLFLSKDGKNHFCLIKNIERLLHHQLTKHKSKIYLCDLFVFHAL